MKIAPVTTAALEAFDRSLMFATPQDLCCGASSGDSTVNRHRKVWGCSIESACPSFCPMCSYSRTCGCLDFSISRFDLHKRRLDALYFSKCTRRLKVLDWHVIHKRRDHSIDCH